MLLVMNYKQSPVSPLLSLRLCTFLLLMLFFTPFASWSTPSKAKKEYKLTDFTGRYTLVRAKHSAGDRDHEVFRCYQHIRGKIHTQESYLYYERITSSGKPISFVRFVTDFIEKPRISSRRTLKNKGFISKVTNGHSLSWNKTQSLESAQLLLNGHMLYRYRFLSGGEVYREYTCLYKRL